MILEPPASVQKLRTALQAKAKEKPDYRFYLLYDKVYRKDVLAYAYQRCKANDGAPGIDGQDFADVEAYGEERWLDELADTLRRKTYRPEAVRRVWIPKANGKLRPLGIPRLADRVVMVAATVVLEAIFEVDMPVEQHGYRPNLSAHTAVKEISRLINRGHTRIIDGDLADYFGSIPHALHALLRRLRAKIGSPRPWRVVPSKAVAQKVEPFLWQFTDMRFGLVDRQLELLHKPSHLGHRLFGAAFATDHEVIGIAHNLRSKPLLQTPLLPSQHKPPHV